MRSDADCRCDELGLAADAERVGVSAYDQTAEALNRLVCSIGPPHENAATGILGRKFSRPTAQNGAFDGVMPETPLRPAEQNTPQRRPHGPVLMSTPGSFLVSANAFARRVDRLYPPDYAMRQTRFSEQGIQRPFSAVLLVVLLAVHIWRTPARHGESSLHPCKH